MIEGKKRPKKEKEKKKRKNKKKKKRSYKGEGSNDHKEEAARDETSREMDNKGGRGMLSTPLFSTCTTSLLFPHPKSHFLSFFSSKEINTAVSSTPPLPLLL